MQTGRGVMLTTYLQVERRLKLSATVILLPVFVFVALSEITFPFTLLHLLFLVLRSQENEVDWTCSNGEGLCKPHRNFAKIEKLGSQCIHVMEMLYIP